RYIEPFLWGKKVLDLGCGRGWLCKKTKKQGYVVTAIDWDSAYPEVTLCDITSPIPLSGHVTLIAAHVLPDITDEKKDVFMDNMACAPRRIFTVLTRSYQGAIDVGLSINVKSNIEWYDCISRYFEIHHVIEHSYFPGHFIFISGEPGGLKKI